MKNRKELMIHVERAMRPIRAHSPWKRRMREELWAHLSALYQAELAASGNEELALARAKESFGDPAAVGADLQRSVPRLDRWLHAPLPGSGAVRRLCRAFIPRAGESPGRHAIRVALILSGLSVLTLLPLFLLALGRPAGSAPILALCGAALVLKDFVFVLLCFAVCRALGGGDAAPDPLRAIGLGLGALLVQVASIPPGRFMVVVDPRSYRDLLDGWRLICTALLTTAFLAYLPIFARAVRARIERDREWASLEIEP